MCSLYHPHHPLFELTDEQRSAVEASRHGPSYWQQTLTPEQELAFQADRLAGRLLIFPQLEAYAVCSECGERLSHEQ